MYIKVILTSVIVGILLLPITSYAKTNFNQLDFIDDFSVINEQTTTFVTTSRVNLRSIPSTDGIRLTIVDVNREVEVIDLRDGVWFFVNYGGKRGYMYAEFLTLLSPPNKTPEPVYVPNSVTIEPDYESATEPFIQLDTFDFLDENIIEEIDEEESQTTFLTTSRVNLRPTPSTDGERITLVSTGRSVEVTDFRDGEWFAVNYNGITGYMSAEFLRELPQPGAAGHVELVDWSTMRNIIPKNTPLTIIDVRTGLTYQITSFSHGNHADVVPATAADTEIMRQAFGGTWDWTPRPVLLIIGDRTFAASINGMPHGSTPNRTNNMNGHICLHFLGARTHNGSRGHERDHQNAVQEAFNTASRW